MMRDLIKRDGIVFAVSQVGGATRYEGFLEFYAFDEDLTPLWDGVDMLDDSVSGWFMTDKSSVAKPISSLDHVHVFQTFLSDKSCVYRVGGLHRFCSKCAGLAKDLYPNPDLGTSISVGSRSVDYWDTTKGSAWTRLPLMNCGRCDPHLHIVNGKLYAIGGTRVSEEKIFIETLSVESKDEWVPLPNPPSFVKLNFDNFLSAVVVHVCGGDPFFLFSSAPEYDVYYAFTPPESWVVVDPSSSCSGVPPLSLLRCIDFFGPLGSGVMLDGHCLYVDSHFIVCISIPEGKNTVVDLKYEGLIPGDPEVPYDVHLVGVGGVELAIVWRDDCLYQFEEKYDYGESYGGYRCCRFTVDFTEAYAGRKCCSLLSYKKCIGPNRGIPLMAAFAVDVSRQASLPADDKKRHYEGRISCSRCPMPCEEDG